MLFSSVTFIYYFLPATLILYYIIPQPKGDTRYRNAALLLAGVVFYSWGEPRYIFLMAAQCVSAWFFGILIDKNKTNNRVKRAMMLISVAVSLSGLIFFKYINFFIGTVNRFGTDLALIKLTMPVGISFYTFQIISYTLDLYRGEVKVQRGLLAFTTYVTLFPQLIAGPIVRYAGISREIIKREHSVPRFALGIRRFIIGLSKKTLLANLFGELVLVYKKSGDTGVLFTWLYILAFALQIYFDFSGYSDMAIGLGHMFGFRFAENFNYPYTAGSVTEFWRRWHISLSGWFRDYIYIPLGGNRVRTARFVFNVMIVWTLTGFWHGADWNFMLCGAYFGVILLTEKFFLIKKLNKAPGFINMVYMILVISIGWALFDAGDITALAIIGRMFGLGAGGLAGQQALYYLRSYTVPLFAGIIGMTPLMAKLFNKVQNRRIMTFVEPAGLVLLFILSTACIVDGSFNPFIYFRF